MAAEPPLEAPFDPGIAAPAPQAAPTKPTRWYQWLLLYPTLALALLTAVPGWVTKTQEIYLGLSGTNRSLAEAQRLNGLIRKNADCLDSPRQWVTTEQLQVDGTICPTGDLMIWVSKNQHEFVDFFEIDQLLARGTAEASAALFSMRAMAAEVPSAAGVTPRGLSRDPMLLWVQEPFAITVCQSFPDERTLVRHLKVGEECYDETIDTYTGAVVSRTPVPCRSSC
jgi:hypothetical protein